LKYYFASLYIILILLIFRFLDASTGISCSLGWILGFFVLGLVASLIPIYRRKTTTKALICCIALFAIFSAGLAAFCDGGRGSLEGRVWRLYGEIKPGMSIEQVDELVAHQVPEIRSSLIMEKDGLIRLGVGDIVIWMTKGIVGGIYVED
jgi:hypothetical protein